MAAVATSLPPSSQPTRAVTLTRADDILNHSPNLLLNLSIWLLAGLASMFLGLRVWCKFLRRRYLWWDDYLLIASWVCLFVGCLLQSADIRIGFGVDVNSLSKSEQISSRIVSQVSGFFLILCAVWSKTSFGLTLLRISNGWIKATVWFAIISINLAIGGSVAIQWFWCWPSYRIFDHDAPGECLPREVVNGYNMAVAGYSGAIDILLAMLPWRIVWTLTMNRKEKFGVAIAMSMGVFAGITSVLKIPAILDIDKPGIIHVINLMIFGTAEGAITIIAASIPILRTLLKDSPRPPPDVSLETIKTVRDIETNFSLPTRHRDRSQCSIGSRTL